MFTSTQPLSFLRARIKRCQPLPTYRHMVRNVFIVITQVTSLLNDATTLSSRKRRPNDTSHYDGPEYEDVLPMSKTSGNEEYHGDESNLNIMCVLVVPSEDNECKQTTPFQTNFHKNCKSCKLLFDNGNSHNIITIHGLQRMYLHPEPPHKVHWVNNMHLSITH